MSASRFNEDLRTLTPGDRVSQAVTAARFNGMATLAREAAMGAHLRGGPGILIKSGPHGTTITQTRRAAGLRVSGRGLDVGPGGTVVPSTIGGVVPKIGVNPISGSYTPLTIGSGTKHVIATISCTLTTSTLDSRVFVSPTLTDVEVVISVTTTVPTSADLISSTGNFKLLLASFLDGSKTLQNGHGPITLWLQDALDGSGIASLMVIYAAP